MHYGIGRDGFRLPEHNGEETMAKKNRKQKH
jgi:hypothetical protein